MSRDDAIEAQTVIIYDGDCPFCSRYVMMMRLRRLFPDIRIIDAREGGQIVESTLQQGFDLDEGMHLIVGDSRYHGADCLHAIALLTSPVGIWNRLNSLVFRSKYLARWLYPIMRFGRNMTLLFLGREKIARTQKISPTEKQD